LLAETALHQELDPGAPGERYQVVVHVDAAVLADPEQPGQSVLEEGGHVPAGTWQRLACDASRVMMRHDAEGQIVEVGARTRTVPPALRRALQHRDRSCRFPGCTVRFGQGHHVRHWAQGGPTTLSNLALLCRRHHRAVHEEGYQIERMPDGALQFRRPNGWLLPEVPPPAAVPADPVGTLRARHAAQGLRVHARTTCPGWLESAWTWAGRSTCCIRGRREPSADVGLLSAHVRTGLQTGIDDDQEFFSDVQERLDWTAPSPTEDEKEHGWLTHEEYVDWVRLHRIGFAG
jgi:5-methylcytosine-specific restriction endonuclease McrA